MQSRFIGHDESSDHVALVTVAGSWLRRDRALSDRGVNQASSNSAAPGFVKIPGRHIHRGSSGFEACDPSLGMTCSRQRQSAAGHCSAKRRTPRTARWMHRKHVTRRASDQALDARGWGRTTAVVPFCLGILPGSSSIKESFRGSE